MLLDHQVVIKQNFFNFVQYSLPLKDDNCVNRHCQFPFQSVPTRCVVLQDACTESCELKTMLKLYSGDQIETNVKCKYHIPVNKVPVTILNNQPMFRTEDGCICLNGLYIILIK